MSRKCTNAMCAKVYILLTRSEFYDGKQKRRCQLFHKTGKLEFRRGETGERVNQNFGCLVNRDFMDSNSVLPAINSSICQGKVCETFDMERFSNPDGLKGAKICGKKNSLECYHSLQLFTSLSLISSQR